MSRFSQVNYDREASSRQLELRQEFMILEKEVEKDPIGAPDWQRLQNWVFEKIPNGRGNSRGFRAISKAQSAATMDDALCFLEEAYMWFGKAIRDEMLSRVKK